MGNYRPVSLFTVVCKIQERLVRRSMYQHMVSNGILGDAQEILSLQLAELPNLAADDEHG